MKIYLLMKKRGAQMNDNPSVISVIADSEASARDCARGAYGRQVLWPSQYDITEIGTAHERFTEPRLVVDI